jgi:ubiquinone/menaquinone biosynthesis C-methylase UbiE
MCIEVIEHVENPLLVFKEFSRLLKNDGVLILTAPFNSLTHYSPCHYATGFSKFYYQKNLPKFNFKIVNIEPNGNYFEYFAQETRRINEVSETYSNKKYTTLFTT